MDDFSNEFRRKCNNCTKSLMRKKSRISRKNKSIRKYKREEYKS
jgi:hypothetical protein